MTDAFRLAQVVGLFGDGTAKIQFLGEEQESEKEYPYLASYAPAKGDKVFLAPFAGSYIIAGKVLYMQGPAGTGGYVTAEELGQALQGYAKANHTHSGYAATSHTHSGYAAASHTHDCTTSASGYTVGWLNATQAWGPRVKNSISCGGSTYKWSVVYAATAAISTSDRNEKKDIAALKEKYTTMFTKLRPVSYRLKENESGRVHVGFIAQDVAEAMEEAGITSQEFAGYIEMPIKKQDDSGKETEETDHIEYGLRYEEFIPLNTMMIQKLAEKAESLERRVTELEGKKNA